jgi:hypothetical protein
MLWHTFHNMGRAAGEVARRTPDVREPAARRRARELAERHDPDPGIPRKLRGRDPATLDAAREAARRYHEQTGARCNVLVSEDGLLYFAQNDLAQSARA